MKRSEQADRLRAKADALDAIGDNSPHPDVPPLPAAYREEFSRLSEHVRKWELNPPFRVGDTVQRRPGTLGATGMRGTVRAFLWKGAHLCAEVHFDGGRVERFVTGTYCR